MGDFLPTKRHVLTWKSNHNLKELNSCEKKSKMAKWNMKKQQLKWNEKVKPGQTVFLLVNSQGKYTE